jgi:hypothetical protein
MALVRGGRRRGGWNQLIFSFFAAPGVLHYWVDGHIVKVRKDPDMRDFFL